ncbi:MAG: DNA polymerase III subunit delta [bacterium]|nr:DNA polymerase III subunit delta [bacterium]
MQTLNQDIKDRTFRPVYLLFGEERYLKQMYKKRLRQAILGEDTMNYSYFEGKGIDVQAITAMADTMPFFAEKRLILVEDSGFFKNASDAMVEYLPHMPETACLVFVEEQVDKRNRLYKKVKELGYAAELNRQNPEQLAQWAGTILARDGKKITKNSMDLFLSMAGDDMENIRMELEKLIMYTMGREVVTDSDIEAVCTVQATNRIFDMIAAVAAKNTRKALDLYEDLLTLKEPPMRILFLIARQFNQLLQVKELMAQGMDKGQIAKKRKLQPFVAGKLMGQARAFSREQILEYVETCAEMDEAVKTGKIADRLAVELLITKR